MPPLATARPRLARGIRLQHDPMRGGPVLLGPERIVRPDPIAAAVLERCTGQRTLADIVDDLAATYAAPRERIEADVRTLLERLAERRLVELGDGP